MTRVLAWLAWVVVCREGGRERRGRRARDGEGSRDCCGDDSEGFAEGGMSPKPPKPAFSFSASPELFVDGGGGGRKGEGPLEWGEKLDEEKVGSTLGLGSLGRCCRGLERAGLMRSGVARVLAKEEGAGGGPRGGR